MKKGNSSLSKEPPNSGQYKKGTSGNPNGRPKGSKNWKTVVKKELASSITVRENGKVKKITKREAAGKAHVAKAMQGDAQHTKLIMAADEEMEKAASQLALNITDENRDQILERHNQRLRAWIIEELRAEKKGDHDDQ